MRQGLWLILLVGRVSTAGKEEEKLVGSQALTSTVRYLFLFCRQVPCSGGAGAGVALSH